MDEEDVPQKCDVVPVTPERIRNLRRYALVAEEAQTHAVTASKSANSRA